MEEKLPSLGSRVFFEDENCDLKSDIVIGFGFNLTNSAGVTFQLIKLQNGNIIRCCDVISSEEVKLMACLQTL